MIKINKPQHPPVVRFIKTGHAYKGFIKAKIALKNVLSDFTQTPHLFLADYDFKHDYGYKEYQEALLNCQGPKCCFCEKPIQNGQIEHFRPKNGWQQTRGKGNPITKPGYYWLAYNWDNMLLSCGECNHSGQKGNLFPVNGFRATDHTMNHKNENHVIIDPSEEDPSRYISFHKEFPIGIDKNGRGDENIQIFKLKTRADLSFGRAERFQLYATEKLIADLDVPIKNITQARISAARKFLYTAQGSKQPFAGMIRENLKNGLL